MKSKIILALLILSFSYVFAQDNPYEVFGHTSKVVYETKVSEYLTVKNSDTTSLTKSIAFNIEEGLVLFLGDKDTILKTAKMQPEQMLRFLSVDPLTKDYPWYTPYQFAGNKPIMAIDLDGLEEFVKIYLPDGGTGYNYIKTINYSDLYPGQQYGPLGKAGTASVLFKTFQGEESFSEAKVQISYLDNNNKRIFKEGIFDFGKTLSTFAKLGKSIQGGANGDPGTSQALTKQDVAVTAGIIGTMTGVGTIVELGIAGAAATEFILPVLSTLNSVDDALANSKGESGLQQTGNSNETKNAIGNLKGGISLVCAGSGVIQGKFTVKSPFKAIGTATDAVSSGQFIKQKAEELKTTK